jgi:hypothetical protein
MPAPVTGEPEAAGEAGAAAGAAGLGASAGLVSAGFAGAAGADWQAALNATSAGRPTTSDFKTTRREYRASRCTPHLRVAPATPPKGMFGCVSRDATGETPALRRKRHGSAARVACPDVAVA